MLGSFKFPQDDVWFEATQFLKFLGVEVAEDGVWNLNVTASTKTFLVLARMRNL